jgi:hypothetical protein
LEFERERSKAARKRCQRHPTAEDVDEETVQRLDRLEAATEKQSMAIEMLQKLMTEMKDSKTSV